MELFLINYDKKAVLIFILHANFKIYFVTFIFIYFMQKLFKIRLPENLI